MNILTIDVEEWFHLLDFDATRTESEWGNYEVRIYENVDRILQILEETDTKATFFVIGWIAKTYPDIVKKISSKYQIGSHTMSHQLIWQQTPEEFRKDAETSIKLLQDITGKPIECFRAPGYSLTESSLWALDILSELGIKYDASVFPAFHSHGGLPEYGRSLPAIICHGNTSIKEFPVTCRHILGRHVIFSGGGYFRLCPYNLIKRWSKECDEYLLSYIHPRDLDAGQPMISGLPLKRQFKSYVGLKSAAEKLKRYLTDFNFIDIEAADRLIDWNNMEDKFL